MKVFTQKTPLSEETKNVGVQVAIYCTGFEHEITVDAEGGDVKDAIRMAANQLGMLADALETKAEPGATVPEIECTDDADWAVSG